MPRTYLIISLLLVIIVAVSCKDRKTALHDHYTIAFYNLENLFDTINDPTIDDEEFLPESELQWNTEKYELKLDHMAKVIASIDPADYIDIIGLCEVENLNVLHDLVNSRPLKKGSYVIIHKDSPDERGIDNALIYRKGRYMPLENQWIAVMFPFDMSRKTRDVLYSKGLIDEDTVHLFVNHWPSRWGGQEKTIPHRKHVASMLKKITDSLFKVSPEVNIIIMGDLNDNPDDESVVDVLHATIPDKDISDNKLYNLSYHGYKNGKGTLYWKSWDMFDQFIVSSSLLDISNDLNLESDEMNIFKPDWILFKPEQGNPRPNRTKGSRYYGGYSDHLPVYVRIRSIKK